jgi:RimJ/RimL family protein N-acetyltransferase
MVCRKNVGALLFQVSNILSTLSSDFLALSSSGFRLCPHTPQHLRALLDGLENYEQLTGLTVARGVRDFIVGPEVSPDFLDQLRQREATDSWQDGFGVLLGKKLIGLCSFAGPPSEDAVVEIAYGIAPDYEGRGYATAAARALIEYAKGTGQVCSLRAYTLPQENASTRVLQKCGFIFVGEAMNSQDGKVWRWERPVNLTSGEGSGNSTLA